MVIFLFPILVSGLNIKNFGFNQGGHSVFLNNNEENGPTPPYSNNDPVNASSGKNTDGLRVPHSSATKSWTFMVYCDGDNNLEGAAITDINEAEKIGSTSDINIVFQLDRASGYDTSNGDWTGTRRYYITKDVSTSTISSTLVEDLGEVDMGSGATLGSFVDWAKSNYPAQKYALILWDHGSGPLWGSSLGGCCWDDQSYSDYLSATELYNTLSPASRHIDVLGFDACLMGSMEIFYQLKDVADVIVGSEKTEPGDGYPYDDILSWLTTHPSASASDLGSQIVDKYFLSYPSYEAITNTAVDTSKLQNLSDKINTLSNLILDQGTNYNSEVSSAKNDAVHFDDNPFIDLYDFCTNLENEITDNSTIDGACDDVMSAINSAIINEEHSSAISGAHGISIYFPDTINDYSSNYEVLRFCSSNSWDEMVKNSMQSPNADDSFEENDDFSTAALVTPQFYHNLRIINGDSDFFKISLNSGDFLNVSLYFSNVNLDLDLYLYDSSQTELNESTSVADYEEVSYHISSSGIYYIEVYPYSAPSSSYSDYDLLIKAPTPDDSYEENDYFSSAADITGQVNSTITNLVWHDDDWFKFTVTSDYLLNISVQFATTLSDLDIFLYYDDGTFLAKSQTSGNENILIGVPRVSGSTTTLYLKINASKEIESYSLLVRTQNVDDHFEQNDYLDEATPVINGTYSNLVCIDSDLYNISLNNGQWLNATILFKDGEGDLDLYLYNPELNLIAWALSYTDNEMLFYYANETGTYTLLVDPYEINLNYTLVLSYVNLTDDNFEYNDYYDSAANITLGNTYTDLAGWNWDVYSLYIPANTEVFIQIDFLNSEGDLDLFLLDMDRNVIDYSATYNDGELIKYKTSTTGEWVYILVYNEESNPHYSLKTSINHIPIAAFLASPTNGTIPLGVNFTDTSVSQDGIASWSWDFGDGNSSTLQNPSHTYYTNGTYIVTLTITDLDGDTDTYSMTIKSFMPAPAPPHRIPGYSFELILVLASLIALIYIKRISPNVRVKGIKS
ncbi:MAG: clostripain-related cysteine peptidase [Promethearchaeota archaeon]